MYNWYRGKQTARHLYRNKTSKLSTLHEINCTTTTTIGKLLIEMIVLNVRLLCTVNKNVFSILYVGLDISNSLLIIAFAYNNSVSKHNVRRAYNIETEQRRKQL